MKDNEVTNGDSNKMCYLSCRSIISFGRLNFEAGTSDDLQNRVSICDQFFYGVIF